MTWAIFSWIFALSATCIPFLYIRMPCVYRGHGSLYSFSYAGSSIGGTEITVLPFLKCHVKREREREVPFCYEASRCVNSKVKEANRCEFACYESYDTNVLQIKVASLRLFGCISLVRLLY
jgi:hypothetical protein